MPENGVNTLNAAFVDSVDNVDNFFRKRCKAQENKGKKRIGFPQKEKEISTGLEEKTFP